MLAVIVMCDQNLRGFDPRASATADNWICQTARRTLLLESEVFLQRRLSRDGHVPHQSGSLLGTRGTHFNPSNACKRTGETFDNWRL